ncbi:hypothetical protein QE372_003760 [Agrobacterium pusense]|uniref:hypothetical protein n=1 Tax=Agrobacterium pusense TaxID=648995 RepID=UPI00285DE2A2|nr:hypothetical protein [Agrobacterium pusense]
MFGLLSLKAMAAATVTGMTAVMAEGTTAAATVTGITAVMAEETTAAAMETEMAVTAAETEARTVAATATAAAMMADMEMEVAKGTETRAEAEAGKHQILAAAGNSGQNRAGVQQSGQALEVRHANGITETLRKGRYSMRDNKGRVIVDRLATVKDRSRFQGSR